MPNPKIQVIVTDELKETLEEEADRQGKTLSSYCAELLCMLHTYPWVVIKAPRNLAARLKRFLG